MISKVTNVGAHQDGESGMPSVHDLISKSSEWDELGVFLRFLDSGTPNTFRQSPTRTLVTLDWAND